MHRVLSKSSLCQHAGVALNVITLCGCVTVVPVNQILHNFSWTLVCVSAQEKSGFSQTRAG